MADESDKSIHNQELASQNINETYKQVLENVGSGCDNIDNSCANLTGKSFVADSPHKTNIDQEPSLKEDMPNSIDKMAKLNPPRADALSVICGRQEIDACNSRVQDEENNCCDEAINHVFDQTTCGNDIAQNEVNEEASGCEQEQDSRRSLNESNGSDINGQVGNLETESDVNDEFDIEDAEDTDVQEETDNDDNNALPTSVLRNNSVVLSATGSNSSTTTDAPNHRASANRGRVRVTGRPPVPPRPPVMDVGLADDFNDGDDEDIFFFAPEPPIAETAPDLSPAALLQQASQAGINGVIGPWGMIPSAPSLEDTDTVPLSSNDMTPPLPFQANHGMNRNDGRDQHRDGANNMETTPVHPTILSGTDFADRGPAAEQIDQLVIVGQEVPTVRREADNESAGILESISSEPPRSNNPIPVAPITPQSSTPVAIDNRGSVVCRIPIHCTSPDASSPTNQTGGTKAANKGDKKSAHFALDCKGNNDTSLKFEDDSCVSAEVSGTRTDDQSKFGTAFSGGNAEESTEEDNPRVASAENDFMSLEVKRNSSSPVIDVCARTDQDADALLHQIIAGHTERGMGPNAAFCGEGNDSHAGSDQTTCLHKADSSDRSSCESSQNTGGDWKKRRRNPAGRDISVESGTVLEGSGTDYTELTTTNPDETSHDIPDIHSHSDSHATSQADTSAKLSSSLEDNLLSVDHSDLQVGPQKAKDNCGPSLDADAETDDADKTEPTSCELDHYELRDTVADTNANLMNQSTESCTGLLSTVPEESYIESDLVGTVNNEENFINQDNGHFMGDTRCTMPDNKVSTDRGACGSKTIEARNAVQSPVIVYTEHAQRLSNTNHLAYQMTLPPQEQETIFASSENKIVKDGIPTLKPLKIGREVSEVSGDPSDTTVEICKSTSLASGFRQNDTGGEADIKPDVCQHTCHSVKVLELVDNGADACLLPGNGTTVCEPSFNDIAVCESTGNSAEVCKYTENGVEVCESMNNGTEACGPTGNNAAFLEPAGNDAEFCEPTSNDAAGFKPTDNNAKFCEPTDYNVEKYAAKDNSTEVQRVKGDCPEMFKHGGSSADICEPMGNGVWIREPTSTDAIVEKSETTSNDNKECETTSDNSQKPNLTGSDSKVCEPRGNTAEVFELSVNTAKECKPACDDVQKSESTCTSSGICKPRGDDPDTNRLLGKSFEACKPTGNNAVTYKPSGNAPEVREPTENITEVNEHSGSATEMCEPINHDVGCCLNDTYSNACLPEGNSSAWLQGESSPILDRVEIELPVPSLKYNASRDQQSDQSQSEPYAHSEGSAKGNNTSGENRADQTQTQTLKPVDIKQGKLGYAEKMIDESPGAGHCSVQEADTFKLNLLEIIEPECYPSVEEPANAAEELSSPPRSVRDEKKRGVCPNVVKCNVKKGNDCAAVKGVTDSHTADEECNERDDDVAVRGLLSEKRLIDADVQKGELLDGEPSPTEKGVCDQSSGSIGYQNHHDISDRCSNNRIDEIQASEVCSNGLNSESKNTPLSGVSLNEKHDVQCVAATPDELADRGEQNLQTSCNAVFINEVTLTSDKQIKSKTCKADGAYESPKRMHTCESNNHIETREGREQGSKRESCCDELKAECVDVVSAALELEDKLEPYTGNTNKFRQSMFANKCSCTAMASELAIANNDKQAPSTIVDDKSQTPAHTFSSGSFNTKLLGESSISKYREKGKDEFRAGDNISELGKEGTQSGSHTYNANSNDEYDQDMRDENAKAESVSPHQNDDPKQEQRAVNHKKHFRQLEDKDPCQKNGDGSNAEYKCTPGSSKGKLVFDNCKVVNETGTDSGETTPTGLIENEEEISQFTSEILDREKGPCISLPAASPTDWKTKFTTAVGEISPTRSYATNNDTEKVILAATDIWLKKISDFCQSPTVLSDSRSDADVHRFTAECRSQIESISRVKFRASSSEHGVVGTNAGTAREANDHTQLASCKEDMELSETNCVISLGTNLAKPISRHRAVKLSTRLPVTCVGDISRSNRELLQPRPPQIQRGAELCSVSLLVKESDSCHDNGSTQPTQQEQLLSFKGRPQGNGDVCRRNGEGSSETEDELRNESVGEKSLSENTHLEQKDHSKGQTTRRVTPEQWSSKRRPRPEVKRGPDGDVTSEACAPQPEPPAERWSLNPRGHASNRTVRSGQQAGDATSESCKKPGGDWPWERPYPRRHYRPRLFTAANSTAVSTGDKVGPVSTVSTGYKRSSRTPASAVTTERPKASSISTEKQCNNTDQNELKEAMPMTREKMSAPSFHKRYRPQKIMTVKEFEQKQQARHVNLDFRRINKTGPSVDCHMNPYVMGKIKGSSVRQRTRNNYNSLLALENCKFLHVLTYTKSVYHGTGVQANSKPRNIGLHQASRHSFSNNAKVHGNRLAWGDQPSQWVGSVKAKSSTRTDSYGIQARVNVRPPQPPSLVRKI